MTHLS